MSWNIKSPWKDRRKKKRTSNQVRESRGHGVTQLAWTCVPQNRFLPSLWLTLSIQNFVRFLVPHLFPLKLTSIIEKEDWNWAGLCRALLGTKALRVSLIWFVEKDFSLLRPSLSFKEQSQEVNDSDKSHLASSSLPRGTDNNRMCIFELFCRN